MHKRIQKDIRDTLREMGYLVVIEPWFDGRNADLLVQDIETLEITIMEIELHKNFHHAIFSIDSDLRYADTVIVFCRTKAILRALIKLSKRFDKKDKQRIQFVSINRHIEFIRTLFQNKNNNKSQNKIRIKEKNRS